MVYGIPYIFESRFSASLLAPAATFRDNAGVLYIYTYIVYNYSIYTIKILIIYYNYIHKRARDPDLLFIYPIFTISGNIIYSTRYIIM